MKKPKRKPTKAEFKAAVKACFEAGCDPELPWSKLSPAAKAAFTKHQAILTAYIGGPPEPEQLSNN